MLAEGYVPLGNFAVSRSSCRQGHYLLTVNTYFFVPMILKVLTKFSFGIGMVITKKYQPIPTKKYQLSIQLYLIIVIVSNICNKQNSTIVNVTIKFLLFSYVL
jgi:hypothetical protein